MVDSAFRRSQSASERPRRRTEMSPTSTSTRSPPGREAAAWRARSAMPPSTSATTRSSGFDSRSARTSRTPMKPGNPVKKITGRAVYGSGDFLEGARLHVVDEAADRALVGDERAGLDPLDRLPHVLLEVVERLRGPVRLDAGVLLDLALEVVVAEGEHPAVGVVDEDDLLGAEQPLRDREGADLVVGHDPAGVADHVRVAQLQTEDRIRVHARVHACHDGDLPGRRQRKVALVEALGEGLVVLQELVGGTH